MIYWGSLNFNLLLKQIMSESSPKKGRVIQSTGKWYKVHLSDTGEIVQSRLPGKFRLRGMKQTNPIAVGDMVDVIIQDDESGLIDEIHDRFNKITRQATHGKKGEHILVSNVDQAFVVQAVDQPKFRTGFIDRFLVTCEAYDVKPKIILNKIDLGTDELAPEVAMVMDVYEGLGYQVILTSIFDQDSLEKLAMLIKDKVSVFIGPSGTGKTSILNHIEPEIERPVAEVSKFSNKGRHTTTFAELLPLSIGGWIADTPGIREFALVDFEPAELSLYFPEMAERREECKYYNCTHLHEPGCAVMQAWNDGLIAASRYDSYINMIETLDDDKGSAGSRKWGR